MNNPNVRQAVPFFWVSNLERSIRYYVDGLGFEMTNSWINNGKLEWCWLQIGNAALMLQEFRNKVPYANSSEGELGLGVSIYFQCEDAIAIYKEVSKRGIEVARPFVGNRMWVTCLVDPDGYRIMFTSATSEPEETVYFE